MLVLDKLAIRKVDLKGIFVFATIFCCFFVVMVIIGVEIYLFIAPYMPDYSVESPVDDGVDVNFHNDKIYVLLYMSFSLILSFFCGLQLIKYVKTVYPSK